jgi:hypothetical protein
MLITAPTQVNRSAGKRRERLTHTGKPSTQHSSVTPFKLPGTQAADPRYALLRLPVFGTEHNSITCAAAWKSVTVPYQPTKAALFNAIQIESLVGRLTPSRAQWLADNKRAPLVVWAAIETGIDYQDTDHTLYTGAAEALIKSIPLKELTAFIVDWASVKPDLIDSELPALLVAAKRYNEGKAPAHLFNHDRFAAALSSTATMITNHLNSMITPLHTDGKALDLSAYRFTYALENDSILESVCMGIMALELCEKWYSLPRPLWEAIIVALRLIDSHLHPVMLPTELANYMYCELDEITEELSEIHSFMGANNLSVENRDDIETALEITERYLITDFEEYQHFNQQVIDSEEELSFWETSQDCTISNLATLAENLTPLKAQSELAADAHTWLCNVSATLARIAPTPDASDQIRSDNRSIFLEPVGQPLFLENDHQTIQQVQASHEMMMNDDESECANVSWGVDAKTCIDVARRMGIGITFLNSLIML